MLGRTPGGGAVGRRAAKPKTSQPDPPDARLLSSAPAVSSGSRPTIARRAHRAVPV